jgi:glucosamine-6-phosphate deaminase
MSSAGNEETTSSTGFKAPDEMESEKTTLKKRNDYDYDKMLEDLGGADACFGGLGINGHVAFNEPPEPHESVTAEEFANLGTRVLPISRETKTINAYGYNRGDLLGMPEWCVTVGMKQILAAKKIYIALNRPWQYGPLKHALFDDETATCPASLLRRVKDVTYCMYSDVAEGLF